MKLKQIIIAWMFILTVTISCDDSSKDKDSQAPAQITNIRFTPNNGGGYFLYDIPNDPDFLYVRADYTIDSGEAISKTSSTYSDTLFIEGLGQVKEYPVKLYTVDRNENASLPVIQHVTPLYPNTDAVLETMVVQPGFSSLIVDWNNELKQSIDVFVEVKVDGKEVTKVYSSNLKKDRFMINNLEGKSHNISVYVKDSYGNISKTKDCGSIVPLIDGKITKQAWSFLRNEFLYGKNWDYSSSKDPALQKPFPAYQATFRDDSLKNAKESHFEGRVQKFWDDEYDSSVKQNLNYFHTGPQSFPFSYFIDMGHTIRASRVAVWQRDTNPYEGENVKTFQLWISDDANPEDGIAGWEMLGTYTIVKPSDPIVAKNELLNGHHFILYPDNPRFTKPFRYLRYKALKSASSANSGCTSEIALYGIDNQSPM